MSGVVHLLFVDLLYIEVPASVLRKYWVMT